ncbi:NTP transferase domain-containing protein [Azospirillum picis]|uniref:Aminoglycoside phosphotransferase domain-containing protein n=1 Tax=Azospirillum picis TaxID=488438 RepID=A0ABU0MD62_9PROT|nr:NTP transferase domain-containing protein [Azospirillum picis]MBP2297604.1 hypothetical protein [Azospirillum picis]MDQ0531373.1 hypothetical protein [Azospirillum picis]
MDFTTTLGIASVADGSEMTGGGELIVSGDGAVPTDVRDIRHVIVQAGGRGSRLEHYSWNKPKCLVPVDGKPLIYDLFDSFPNARFTVILDHKAEVFERFIQEFKPAVPVTFVRSQGTGTCSGIRLAMEHLPDEDTPFLLVWSDLKFDRVPGGRIGDRLLVGLTDGFSCRWSWSPAGGLAPVPSGEAGVMGMFGVPGRRVLSGLPDSGEFVRWLSEAALPIDVAFVEGAREYGTLAALHAHWAGSAHARFFNDVRIRDDRVEKRTRTPRFAHLIEREAAWYRKMEQVGFRHAPALLAEHPLTLERLHGEHPCDLPAEPAEQRRILERIMLALEDLHGRERRPANAEAADALYRTKTLERLQTVRRLLPELTARESLRVNGVPCRNILHDRHRGWFEKLVDGLVGEPVGGLAALGSSLPGGGGAHGRFTLIHGDPTFSNILVDKTGKPWFIDPRGSFGGIDLFGDPRYDWAKLYYSVVGDYDSFNRKQFLLQITGDGAEIEIRENGWSHLRGLFQERLAADLPAIRLIHALVWLSLSGYVEDDYDSIVGAYVRGLQVLNEAAA